ncbi:MAG: hypothetical protein JXQ82_01740 [Methanomicrobiaceae archaeon]|nr:hypothetical protein [Methanomicrobiaceae archaeon]
MERLDEKGQWIVLMGFIISVGIFFLAIILNQSVMVGQTTSEGVLEFPKAEIRDLRTEIIDITVAGNTPEKQNSITTLAMERENAIVWYSQTAEEPGDIYTESAIEIHFNNGVTSYYENYPLFEKN